MSASFMPRVCPSCGEVCRRFQEACPNCYRPTVPIRIDEGDGYEIDGPESRDELVRIKALTRPIMGRYREMERHGGV